MTTNAMPQKHDSQRSRQRMYEIQLYEEEMRIQEATAFTMSEHEHQVLTSSFASVKFEFSDLDGLTWSPCSNLCKLYSPMAHPPYKHSVYPRTRTQSESHSPFSVLSNQDLPRPEYKREETVRPSPSLPTLLSSSFHSHAANQNIIASYGAEDDDPTPMSTPTQAQFSFDSRTSPIPPSNSTSAVDLFTTAPVSPATKDQKRLRLRLPVKIHREDKHTNTHCS